MKIHLKTFFAFILCLPSLAFSNSAPDFESTLRREVNQATQAQGGVVLWMDLKTQKTMTLGNAELADQKFRPGSLFKLITAEALLPQNPKRTFTCTGQMKIRGISKRCWTYRGHSKNNLAAALGRSCNLFFGSAGEELGLQNLIATLKNYAGLPLPSADEQAKLQKEVFEFAIGDSSFYKVSPRQMMAFWSQYLEKLQGPEYSPIAQGLKRTIAEGTARRSQMMQLDFFAKTGTSDAERGDSHTDAWYLAAVPAEKPRFALLIFLRDAYAFREASELAKKILESTLRFQMLSY